MLKYLPIIDLIIKIPLSTASGFSMNKHWILCDSFKNSEFKKYFSSLDAVFAQNGEVVSVDPISSVKKVSINDRYFYVKTYTAGGKKLRRYIGRSRVRAEWENLKLFQTLEIPTAKLVGYGEEIKFGVFQRGALITEAVPNTENLEQHVKHHPHLARNRRWMSEIIKQVAHHTKLMHESRFTHNDLNWRNILVTTCRHPKVFFIDCPSGKISNPPFLARRITKDLAHLDKIARKVLPKVLQLKFYQDYTGRARLSSKDKRYIRKITNFHNKHRARKQRRLFIDDGS